MFPRYKMLIFYFEIQPHSTHELSWLFRIFFWDVVVFFSTDARWISACRRYLNVRWWWKNDDRRPLFGTDFWSEYLMLRYQQQQQC